MESTVKERLIQYLKYKKVGQNKFENLAGISNGYISNLKSTPGTAHLTKILNVSPDLNEKWLMTGEGEMLKTTGASPSAPGTRVPFYKDMPVSAGKAELMELDAEENAVGFINITGVTGKYAFPVIGCSMEPVIHPGDIVVVDELNQWDKIDPDKIYLVFTHDDRMIKHLETDEADTDIIWCVSPNYKRFSLQKTDILRIYKVTFYGRLA